jgi:microcystin-dependent protein
MSQPFLAEIRVFPFNFAPEGWAMCSGQILPIVQNTALFSLLGTTYGGNGTSTYALPDFRGRVPIHTGTSFILGQAGGSETTFIAGNNLPAHSHPLNVVTAVATTPNPGSTVTLAATNRSGPALYATATPAALMSSQAIGLTGSGQAISVRQPSLVFTFCIALVGIFPSRS